MLYAPEVSVPALEEFQENEDVVVNCNVSANPPAHAVVWTKQGDDEFKQVGGESYRYYLNILVLSPPL